MDGEFRVERQEQTLGHLMTTGRKMPFLITLVYGVMNFLYGKTRARLERRNAELELGRQKRQFRDVVIP